jgi:hypothetical protein
MAKILYQCELCRLFVTPNRKEIEKHEKIPIKEGSIGGLIVNSLGGTYQVYKKLILLDDTHTRLYVQDNFNWPPDKYWKVDTKTPYRGGSEQEFIKHLQEAKKFTKELSEEEFMKITKIIREKNPIYYKNTQFKQFSQVFE